MPRKNVVKPKSEENEDEITQQDPRTKIQKSSTNTKTTNKTIKNSITTNENSEIIISVTTRTTIEQKAKVTEISLGPKATQKELKQIIEITDDDDLMKSGNRDIAKRETAKAKQSRAITAKKSPSGVATAKMTPVTKGRSNRVTPKDEVETLHEDGESAIPITQSKTINSPSHVAKNKTLLKPGSDCIFNHRISDSELSEGTETSDDEDLIDSEKKDTAKPKTTKTKQSRVATAKMTPVTKGRSNKVTPKDEVETIKEDGESAIPSTQSKTINLPSLGSIPKKSTKIKTKMSSDVAKTKISDKPRSAYIFNHRISDSELSEGTETSDDEDLMNSEKKYTAKPKTTKTKQSRAIKAKMAPVTKGRSNKVTPKDEDETINEDGESAISSTQSITINSPSHVPKNKTLLKPGFAYIFNHRTFDSELSERIGTDCDVEYLKRVFDSFKLTTVIYEDPSLDKIRNVITTISKRDFKRHSCLVIVILSHGSRNEKVMAKDKRYSIDDEIVFKIIKNESLSNKPKIFFVQACKGNIEILDTDKEQKAYGSAKEIIKCYSTYEGFVAYRTPEGSVFIRKLCEYLMKMGRTEDIESILRLVTVAVEKETQGKQIPTRTSNLSKNFVFGDYI